MPKQQQNLHNNSKRKMPSHRRYRYSSGYEVTKSQLATGSALNAFSCKPSSNQLQTCIGRESNTEIERDTLRERARERGGGGKKLLQHPQFSFNWLSPSTKTMKMENYTNTFYSWQAQLVACAKWQQQQQTNLVSTFSLPAFVCNLKLLSRKHRGKKKAGENCQQICR